MAIQFYNSATTDGGAIGAVLASGVKGAILPKVSSTDRSAGITIHRKLYIVSDDAIDIDLGIDGFGIFSACIFEGTSEAQVVGDLTGSETKYGAGKIVKLEDSSLNTETVNGAGGLSDILKITVADDVTGDVYFRTGEKFYIGSNRYTIGSVASVAEGTEITLSGAIPHYGAIGKNAFSLIESSIVALGNLPLWLKITVQPDTITELEYNTFAIQTVF